MRSTGSRIGAVSTTTTPLSSSCASSGRLRPSAWVCDGNYTAVVRPHVLARATDVVILDYDRAVVMRRVIWRSFSRWLLRTELWPGTGNRESVRMWLEPDHPIRWAWATHPRRRARFAEMVADPALAHIRFHRLTRPAEARALVRGLAALRHP